MNFTNLHSAEKIYLYAGDMAITRRTHTGIPFVGLSLTQNNELHIKHDVTKRHDLPDNSVDIYQSEDVFEHIEYSKLPAVLDDIYRILKPGGLFRLSMPDYRCDVLNTRSYHDPNGEIYFDQGGGGKWDSKNRKVIGGGHVWFPTYETVKKLLDSSKFKKVTFLHYYTPQNKPVMSKIDYSKGWIKRTPDNDPRVQNPARPMSIVVDCYK